MLSANFKLHILSATFNLLNYSNSRYDLQVISFLPENKSWHFVQIVSRDNLKEMPSLIFWKNKKKTS